MASSSSRSSQFYLHYCAENVSAVSNSVTQDGYAVVIVEGDQTASRDCRGVFIGWISTADITSWKETGHYDRAKESVYRQDYTPLKMAYVPALLGAGHSFQGQSFRIPATQIHTITAYSPRYKPNVKIDGDLIIKGTHETDIFPYLRLPVLSAKSKEERRKSTRFESFGLNPRVPLAGSDIIACMASLVSTAKMKSDGVCQISEPATVSKLANDPAGTSDFSDLNSLPTEKSVFEDLKGIWGKFASLSFNAKKATKETAVQVQHQAETYRSTLVPNHIQDMVQDELLRQLISRLGGHIDRWDDSQTGAQLEGREARITTKLEQISNQPVEEAEADKITVAEWNRWFPGGVLSVPVSQVTERIFKAGLAEETRPVAYPFLFEMFRWTSSPAERELEHNKQKSYYQDLTAAWMKKEAELNIEYEAIKTRFEEEGKPVFSLANVEGLPKQLHDWRHELEKIQKDVNRLDRDLAIFARSADEDGTPESAIENNESLMACRNVLLAYHEHNKGLLYVQGMSDLVGLLYSVLTDEVATFACFVGMMRTMEGNFLQSMQGILYQTATLQELVQLLDPQMALKLKSEDIEIPSVMFKPILLRMKREFNHGDTLRIYEALWSNHLSGSFHLFCCMALLSTFRSDIFADPQIGMMLWPMVSQLNGQVKAGNIIKQAHTYFLRLKETIKLYDEYISGPRLKWMVVHPADRHPGRGPAKGDNPDRPTLSSRTSTVKPEPVLDVSAEPLERGKVPALFSEVKTVDMMLHQGVRIPPKVRDLLSQTPKDTAFYLAYDIPPPQR